MGTCPEGPAAIWGGLRRASPHPYYRILWDGAQLCVGRTTAARGRFDPPNRAGRGLSSGHGEATYNPSRPVLSKWVGLAAATTGRGGAAARKGSGFRVQDNGSKRHSDP